MNDFDLNSIVKLPGGQLREQRNQTLVFKGTKQGFCEMEDRPSFIMGDKLCYWFESNTSFKVTSAQIVNGPMGFSLGLIKGIEGSFVEKSQWAGKDIPFLHQVLLELCPMQWFGVKSLTDTTGFLLINGIVRLPVGIK